MIRQELAQLGLGTNASPPLLRRGPTHLGGGFNPKADTLIGASSGNIKTTTSIVAGNLVSAPGIRQNVMLAASLLDAF